MKTDVIRSLTLRASSRMDARYHLSPGVKASEFIEVARAKGVTLRTIGGEGGLGRVWRPLRFKRAYAAPGEASTPYLRPYDVFEYLPVAADMLSLKRNKRIGDYRLRRGMLLQTCSGRNLGPAVAVDEYLSRFVVGDDIIRIEIDDESIRLYVLAYLQSEIGQNLIKRGKTGSVIDHVSDAHLAKINVPIIAEKAIEAVAKAMRHAIERRERARVFLDDLLRRYESELPSLSRPTAPQQGWTVSAKHIGTRLDAAFHDLLVKQLRKALQKMGGRAVKEVARVIKPGGRYKTCYVDREYGLPILSGAQLLQAYPINLRYMSPKVFKNPERYAIKRPWIAYPADGRAEDALGLPSMVVSNREGWLASGHVGRVIPNHETDPGWLWLACRTAHAQLQLKAAASGSVVDSTFVGDMERVILPPPFRHDYSEVASMWENFAKAEQDEQHALSIIDSAFRLLAK